ncbi:MAG: tetratricopeptide repeat-containing sensor histidine kinase [Ignavibacteria bacterium]|nr:tetratricopeptide repeat-containing sensor histidine kinase [Ignavibacteria bacterium]
MKLLFTFLGLFLSCCMYLTAADKAVYTAEFEALTRGKSQTEKYKILEDTCLFSSNYSKALLFSEKYLELANETRDKKQIATGYRLIGRTYWLQGKLSASLENLFKALQLYQEINDSYGMAKTSVSIGVNYAKLDEYDKALKYYMIARQKFEILDDELGLAQTYINSSDMYLNINDRKRALVEGVEALRRYKIGSMRTIGPDSNMGVAMSLGKLAEIYRVDGNLDSAIHLYKQALVIERNINHKHGIATTLLFMIDILFKQQKFGEAENLAKEALDVSKEIEAVDLTSNALRDLAIIYKQNKNYEKALDYFEQYQAVRDTIVKYDARAVSAKFELQSAEAEYKVTSELQSAKQTYTIVIASLIVLSLLIIAFIFYNRNKLTKKLNNQLAESNTTKNKLFAVISHDLKGPLSAFSELSNILSLHRSSISETERAKIMANMHSSSVNILGLLDNLLGWSRSQMKGYKLYPELIIIHELVQEVLASIADLAAVKNIQLLNLTDTSIELTADRNALEMVLRNLIHNAIKFSHPNGKVEVRACVVNGHTEITVVDEGIGLSESSKLGLFTLSPNKSTIGTAMEKGTGLGLVLCKDIIELHGGTIRAEANNEVGTKFIITL